MKVLIDEGVPRQLVDAFLHRGLDAHRFPAAWRGLTNGRLIAAAEASAFDVLVTNDKNMGSQQRLSHRSLAVVALPLNRRYTLLARADDIVDTVRLAKPGDWISMDVDGSRSTARLQGERPTVIPLAPIEPFR